MSLAFALRECQRGRSRLGTDDELGGAGARGDHLGDREDVDATFLQPFVAFTTSKYTTFTLNTESSYNWEGNDWSVPVNAMVSQLFKIGGQPMSIQFGARYWADTPQGQGPEGWGWRLAYTLVFPKK